ncbi:hypothetical protein SAMN04489743_2142 [Pseudarthrobacter equi]|uniref:Uncharacterized protein n=1 Tax=Pseudarthrobacter equi TaxID=728066 RepID=A0A1H1YTW8_9MICC|nr:hypothetical protein SAMN04489743_2142 [Pseudarthrobacter equi]
MTTPSSKALAHPAMTTGLTLLFAVAGGAAKHAAGPGLAGLKSAVPVEVLYQGCRLTAGFGGQDDLYGLDPFAQTRCSRSTAVGRK